MVCVCVECVLCVCVCIYIYRIAADVKVQNTLHGRNNITCSTDCKYRTAATLYTVETCFVSGI